MGEFLTITLVRTENFGGISGKFLRLENFQQETYKGVHEGPLKGRIYGHNTNFKNIHHKGQD